MSYRIDSQPARIATDSGDEEGLLLFLDGALVAVVSRLRTSVSDEWSGLWFLEAGFGPCAFRSPGEFASVEAAVQWVIGCIEENASEVRARAA